MANIKEKIVATFKFIMIWPAISLELLIITLPLLRLADVSN